MRLSKRTSRQPKNIAVNAIANRLSLRLPQRDALDILATVCEIAPLEKGANVSKINSEGRGDKAPRIKRLSEYIGESYFHAAG